jgi:lactate dehydrogenase-like 2-hydroxyacid dehydrogenase
MPWKLDSSRVSNFTPEELLSAADGADGMFVTPADRLDAAFFNRVASSVKVIATHSIGNDHIDLKAAAARKIAHYRQMRSQTSPCCCC